MIIKSHELLLPIVLFSVLVPGCTLFLVGPSEPNSALVIGRVVVTSKFPGAFYGLLPLGTVDKGLNIEIESQDGKQAFSVTTADQGYFVIPNIPPNTYHLLRVTMEGGRGGGDKERYGIMVR